MRRTKGSDPGRPTGHAGEGAASALKEMLRRQAGNPAPGSGSSKPADLDPPREEPRPPGHRPLH